MVSHIIWIMTNERSLNSNHLGNFTHSKDDQMDTLIRLQRNRLIIQNDTPTPDFIRCKRINIYLLPHRITEITSLKHSQCPIRPKHQMAFQSFPTMCIDIIPLSQLLQHCDSLVILAVTCQKTKFIILIDNNAFWHQTFLMFHNTSLSLVLPQETS